MDQIVLKFITWTKLKIRLHVHNDRLIYFHPREIWWASLGANIGREQDGKNERFERPILILKVFNTEMFWALPLTSKNKVGKYYHSFYFKGKISSIILSQIRTMSSKRLLRKIGTISEKDFQEIKSKVRNLLV